MKKIIIPIGLVLSISTLKSQSNLENYVQARTYLEPVTTTQPNAKQMRKVEYYDGLGKLKQIVNVKITPQGRDVVIPVIYDGFGRQTREYLPVPQSGTQDGLIYTQNSGLVPFPVGDPQNLYTNERAFSEKILESSPLDRLQQQIQIGTDWMGKPIKYDNEANTVADAVKKFTTSTSWVGGATKSIPSNAGVYGANQLYKNTVTDEDGNKTIEFKNGKGQVILIRNVVSASENADTYYIYNEYNQLAFVVPPMLSKIQSWTPADQDNLAYEYRYDGGNLMVEKKLPGKDWEYMVYDKSDRLILSQDANLRTQNKWVISKYDKLGRVVYTGYLTGGERAARQNEIKDLLIIESRNSTGFTRNGMTVYYTDNNFAGQIPTLLSVNYYDSYPPYNFNPDLTIPGKTVLTEVPNADGRSTKGLPVATLLKNVEDDNWTKNYTLYDDKARVIGSHSINYLGGYTRIETDLDFSGVTLSTQTKHFRRTTEPEVNVKERFEYDNQNRLLKHYHQVDYWPEQLLAENIYNEFAQLATKKVGNNLQSIDYAYNVKGWLTDVNKDQMGIPDLGGKLFAYKIKYNQKNGITKPDPVLFAGKDVQARYNGNIAEVDWRAVESIGANPPMEPKRYGYVYDGLNRVTAGYYQNPNNPYSREHTESIDYDLNGNITNLYRTSVMENGNTTATVIDNIEYTNVGNHAVKMKDLSKNKSGYEGTVGSVIEYDLNGNMKNMLDKQITGIGYNHLNLQNSLVIGSGQITTEINNKFRSDGVKVRKENTFTSIGITNTTWTKEITDYLDGFQYLNKTASNNGGGGSTDMFSKISSESQVALEMEAFKKIPPIDLDPPPIDPIVKNPHNPELQFFATTEGFYDYQKKSYIYQYKDHLGNVRVSFSRNNQNGAFEITDANDYYPFGMNHLKTGGSYFGAGSYKNYKYNRKELQETGMYDYGWRHYMPDVGRWTTSDPLIKDLDFTFNPNEADDDDDDDISAGILLANGGGVFNVKNLNPYAYGYNDPIRYDDPDGRCPNCLTALGGALIGGGLELGGQLLSGKSFKEVDWADVAIETGKGALAGAGLGVGAKFLVEAGSVVAKAAVDYSGNEGNQNIFNGKKSGSKAWADGLMDVAAGKAGGAAAKQLNKVSGKFLAKATVAETKALRNVTLATNNFNRLTNGGRNMYGVNATLATSKLAKSKAVAQVARKNAVAAKITKTVVKNGEVVNKAIQGSLGDKIKSWFGF
ncbi:RHS repeat-associated core domain-containing protein [Chryseobacterium capnotolerans]|uniref:DUF6443 domain-containing protein n=1 Tax=Chryseobacterium TaxID=59732 RepID=UPI00083A7E76|nr:MULTISPECIES: DUF6443 domain-containing protein [Chryseobacterium]UHO38113.1 RHS repeat-associated core domain-containing protein [Chryseobacterium capnotolerans]